MAGALWKSSTGLASSATLTRLKCPRITPRQLSSNVNNGPSPGTNQQKDAFQLAKSSLSSMMGDIHSELEAGLSLQASQLGEVARYYFDGAGKAVRPVIAVCLGKAALLTTSLENHAKVEQQQRKVALVSEMIHTASLLHDDVLDHALTRRGKPSVNFKWDARRSTFAGDYILAVGSRLMAEIESAEVTVVLSQVLADLVQGEFQQLETKEDEGQERFEHYLTKSFNKTASLMAHTCQANALLAGVEKELLRDAFLYGRNIGVAFQLVDDLLDFTASADQLGKPAAADLSLGLATAPVLFAAETYPHLNTLIARRFEADGDVEEAFRLVRESGGLEETRSLAKKHATQASDALSRYGESEYKNALVKLPETVLNRMK